MRQRRYRLGKRTEFIGEGPAVGHRGERLGFKPRAGALGEFVQRADMVGMDVGRHRQHELAWRQVEFGRERRQPHAGVDDEIAITAFEVIEIRPEIFVQERLGIGDEARVDRGPGEP